MPVETWYVLETGEVANPRDVRTNADGVLVHKDGRKVAYAPHGPRSRSVDTDKAKQMKPAQSQGGYQTRVMDAAGPLDHDQNGAPGGALPATERGLDALREQASELGVHVDNRWGERRLRDEIAKAQEQSASDSAAEDQL